MSSHTIFRIVLTITFIFTLFLGFSQSEIVYTSSNLAQVQPTFGYIVPCPSCASTTNVPSPGQATINAPKPTSPCKTDTATSKSKSSKHKKHTGAISGSVEKIIQLFIEFLNLIIKQFGGSEIALPKTAPEPKPTTASEPLPTTSSSQPTTSQPEPTAAPCPPTSQPLKTTAPSQAIQPSQAQPQPSVAAPSGAAPSGSLSIKVEGNSFVDQNNKKVRLLGANRSGTQYMCMDGTTLTDGPGDDASIQAMKAWGMTAVRVNGNEDCWLGINGAKLGGDAYHQAIGDFIKRINAAGMYVIYDMHHSAPGTQPANDQQKMPDRDHAVPYWSSVAAYFKDNHAVVFDLYNEPHPDSGNGAADWKCVKDGGTCQGVSFPAEGMTQMLAAVRQAGANNPVIIGGPEYAGTLDQWIENKPNDPANQLAASVHIYGKPLGSPYDDPSKWDTEIGKVAQQVPIVIGEMGDTDCTHKFIDQLMPWADQHGVSYIGWSWTTSSCTGEPALITSYDGTPTAYGIGLRDHLKSLPK